MQPKLVDIFSSFSIKMHVVGTHKKHLSVVLLNEVLLMGISTTYMYVHGEIWILLVSTAASPEPVRFTNICLKTFLALARPRNWYECNYYTLLATD